MNREDEFALAQTAAAGDPEARRVVDQLLHAACLRAQRLLRLSSSERDDLLQRLRVELLVGTGSAPPKLASYSNRGSLEGFIRTVAMRTGLNGKRDERARSNRDTRAYQEALKLALDLDVEAELLRAQHAEEIRDAVEAAFLRLPATDRALAKLHFVDGLGIDAIAKINGTHRATAARMLQRIRQALRDEVARMVHAKLGLSEQSYLSLVRAVASVVELESDFFEK